MNSAHSYILTYHSLDDTGSVISMLPETFRAQMDWLARSGTPVVPLSGIRETPGAVAITFDDGFRNFFEHAFPVLQEHHFPATVFVITGYCGGRNDWPSQPPRPVIPTLDLMRWSEVGIIAEAGISVGSHSATHPRLSSLSEADVETELCHSRAILEDRTGQAVDAFAYPYGDSTPAVRRAVARYFRCACSANLGFVSRSSDHLSLPRIDGYYLRNQLWFRGLGKKYGEAYVAVRRSLRSLRRRLVTNP